MSDFEQYSKYVSKMVKFYLKLKLNPELSSNKRFMRKRSDCAFKAVKSFPENEQIEYLESIAPDLIHTYLMLKKYQQI